MSGQGFHFGGEKARLLKQRLRQLKADPAAAARLFGNKPKKQQVKRA